MKISSWPKVSVFFPQIQDSSRQEMLPELGVLALGIQSRGCLGGSGEGGSRAGQGPSILSSDYADDLSSV